MKIKFLSLLFLLVAGLFFTSCDDNDGPRPVTYSLNSGSDEIDVYVYDQTYRGDNKCLPDHVRKVEAWNGVYTHTSPTFPGEPIMMYVVFPKGYKGEAKAVIQADGAVVHRSNAATQASAIFYGTYRHQEVKRKLSWSRVICNNPLILEWGESSYDTE